MTIKSLGALVLGALLFQACNQSKSKQDQEPARELTKGEIRKSEFGHCDSTGGVSVKLNLWEPADSGVVATRIRAILTEKTIQRINSYGDSASIAAHPEAKESPKAAFEVFQKNYNDFKKDFPDAPGCWEVGLEGDTIMVTPKFFFYQLDHYAFTGGAHPNSFTSFHAFDTKTGEETDLKAFIADSVALLKIVEQKFREVEKQKPEANLEEEGYFLLDHKFFIPANFVFTAEGVRFYYNPYEIAAYARGAIDFTIPYDELKGMVKADEVF